MDDGQAPCRIAVIGSGPRGLGALEALAERVATGAGRRFEVLAFDPSDAPGAGPNFHPAQNPLALLNIPVRSIAIDPPALPRAWVPSFAAWDGGPPDPDRYPARAELGAWLVERWAMLGQAASPALDLKRRTEIVIGAERGQAGWWLTTGTGRVGPFDEVLIAPGQPATKPDEQLARWQAHAQATGADLLPAYPDADLIEAAQGWAGQAVAIRGLGLSTLDVLRFLTRGLGGWFEDGRYCPSGREPGRILPFSLTGHPPWPKPATARLDARFDPAPDETALFRDALAVAMEQEPRAALDTLCGALAGPARRMLAGSSDAPHVADWLRVERCSPGAQEARAPVQALRHGIAMAEGRIRPSAGYAVGQLWRKWQDALRQGFNPGKPSPETAAAIIAFDEGLKRYSYGPPVTASRELLALVDCGLVDLRTVDDPDIRLVADGWHLVEDDATAQVTAMVDSVLPGPALAGLTDPLLAGLRAEGRLSPVAEGLGARIRPDGQAIGRDGRVQRGLSLLGRPALGSVIAVDSLHDCFGASADRWAEGVIARAGHRRRAALTGTGAEVTDEA